MKLADADILKLLPEHISGDPRFSAVGKSVNPVLRTLDLAIPNLLIYARLGGQSIVSFLPPLRRLTEARPGLAPLSTGALEALAWQFHVDFREVARTDAQLAAMILSSIGWHRIKGTPASIKKALALFGYGGIKIEEHAPDMPWATFQLGLSEAAELSDLEKICAIVREMQPARCRLWRVYNDAWDQRPGIWDYGKPERLGWDNFWWDLYSGLEIPQIPGEQGGLVVSFGNCRRVQSRPWQKTAVIGAFGQEATIASIIPYQDHFIWDVSAWDEVFVRNHGFVAGEVVSLQVGELQFKSDNWQDGGWNENPWGEGFHYDRDLPPFEIFWHTLPWSQLVHDDESDKLISPQGCGLAAQRERSDFHANRKRPLSAAQDARPKGIQWSGYDDLNSCHDVPLAQISEAPPAWDAFLWDEDSRQILTYPVYEQFAANLPLPAEKLNPLFNADAMVTYRLSSLSGNKPLAIKPEIGCQSLLALGAGQIEWQSAGWNDDLWDYREWGKAVSLAPIRKPCAITVSEIAENWNGNWNENLWNEFEEENNL